MRPAIPFCAGVGLLRSYLASVAIILTAYATPWEPDLENPRTITPFQTAAYVADLEAARLLNGLAEFAVGLLIWDDTDRLIATQVGTLLPKGLLAPFFAEHNSGRPARLKADSVRDRVSDAYRNLRSPRLVDIEIHQQIDNGKLPTIETAEKGTPIPFRVTNRRDEMIEFVLQEFVDAGRHGRRMAILLAPGETRGFFWTLPAGLTGPTLRLTAAVGDLSRTLALPLRRRASSSQSFLVLDETGVATPARIYAKGADGRARAPAGVMQRVVTGEYSQPFPGEVYFYTSGRFTLQLPEGVAEIEVVKGLEYHPLRIDLDVNPNSTDEIPLKLTRMANLGAKGWHSGDNHVHANLFYEDRIKPSDVMVIAKAEDLNVVNVLPCNDPRTEEINDLRYFEGRPNALSESRYILYFNQELRNNLYHHVGFLNLKSFIEPGYSGWPRSRFPYDSEPNYTFAMEAKAQGAVVTYVHPGLPSEYPVDFALGAADALDVLCQNDEEVNTAAWYKLLNCGFRVPISAGPDSFLNIPCHLVAGAGRVYVQTRPTLDYGEWIEAFRRGHSFATNGPLLDFTVDGLGPGHEIHASAAGRLVEIKGQAHSIVPMESLEIILNGRVLEQVWARGDRTEVAIARTFNVNESGWLGLRVRGPGHRLAPNDREVYAHTSPVYLCVEGHPPGERDAARFFVDQIDELIERVTRQGKFETPAQRERVIALFRKGQDVYRRIVHEAIR